MAELLGLGHPSASSVETLESLTPGVYEYNAEEIVDYSRPVVDHHESNRHHFAHRLLRPTGLTGAELERRLRHMRVRPLPCLGELRDGEFPQRERVRQWEHEPRADNVRTLRPCDYLELPVSRMRRHPPEVRSLTTSQPAANTVEQAQGPLSFGCLDEAGLIRWKPLLIVGPDRGLQRELRRTCHRHQRMKCLACGLGRHGRIRVEPVLTQRIRFRHSNMSRMKIRDRNRVEDR